MKAFLLITSFSLLTSTAFAKDCRSTSENLVRNLWSTSPVPYDQSKTMYGDSAFGRLKNASASQGVRLSKEDWSRLSKITDVPVEIRKVGKETVISKIRYSARLDRGELYAYRSNPLQIILDHDCELLSLNYSEPQRVVVSQYECTAINLVDSKNVKNYQNDMKKFREVIQARFKNRRENAMQLTDAMTDKIAAACAPKFGTEASAIAQLLPRNGLKNENPHASPGNQSPLPRPALRAD